MPGRLKDFFNFNKTERNGIFALLVLIIIVALAPRYFRYLKEPEKIDFTAFQKDIESFEKGLEADSAAASKQQELDFEHLDRSIAGQTIKPFPFNPNEITAEKWKQLGLKDWQIRTIMNYKSKGGKFNIKDDVKKIYGITEAEYELLQPYILLPATYTKTIQTYPKTEKPAYKQIIVDLNTADSVTLLELKGIGPSFARRIIRYRDLLGGFYSVSQLMEVYGFDQARYDQVAPYCLVGNGPIKKINLNTVTTAELKKHPYLDFYTAKAIVDRRIAKGQYTSVGQIKDMPLVYGDLYEKIKNYFSVE